MQATLIFWLGLAAMLMISLVVGLWKRASDAKDWLSASGQLNAFWITCSIIGTMVGGAIFVAVVVMGYEYGIVGIYIGLAYFFGLFLLGFFSPRIISLLDESESETLFHFVCRRLGKRTARLYAIVSALLFTMAVAGQVLALRHYLLGAPGIGNRQIALWGAIIACFAVVIIYIFFGGLRKDVISDFVQLLFMIAGLSFVLPKIFALPTSQIIKKVDAQLLTVGAYGPWFMLGILLLVTPMLLVRADLWQRIRAAKSPKQAALSFYISAPIVAACYCFFTYIGLLARGLQVNKDSNLIVGVLESGVGSVPPRWLVSCLLVAFVGAVLSSLDSLLNLASIALVRSYDLGEDRAESATSLRLLKCAAVVVIGATIIILCFFSNIVDVFVGAISFVMVLAPPVLHVFSGREASKRGAFYSVISGTCLLVICWLFIPKLAFIPASALGWVVYFCFVAIENYKRRKSSESDILISNRSG